MPLQQLAILGSTGSIGTQTLDIVRSHQSRFRVTALSAHSNWQLLAQQINEFRPLYAHIADPECHAPLKHAVKHSETELLGGSDTIDELVTGSQVDTVVNSLVGFSGFGPTVAALSSGKKVALANKESLVVGGALLQPYLNGNFDRLIPIDSEHSAILQCLTGEQTDTVDKLIITASGGPFREWPVEKLQTVGIKDALAHPNWEMGSKITIDSATMMNKGLEVIEAHWLFGLPAEKIEAVVHPQSIVHSMVLFNDGSIKAQMGLPDMRLPIQYALSYPERWPQSSRQINWSGHLSLSFEPVDMEKFPCYKLALEALAQGGFAPTVLNASNEIAVERFLKEEISYIEISRVVEQCLTHIEPSRTLSVEALEEIDRETRVHAHTV